MHNNNNNFMLASVLTEVQEGGTQVNCFNRTVTKR